MDILNSIKEWLGGLAGDTAANLGENLNTEELQQQVDDTVQNVTDTVEQAKDTLQK